jgi:CubicO group peptidase (beta-lactamase class C family)
LYDATGYSITSSNRIETGGFMKAFNLISARPQYAAVLFLMMSVAVWANPSETAVVAGAVGQQLDQVVQQKSETGFSGVVFVAKKGSVLLEKGYGSASLAGKRPNAANNVFCVGSLTKSFTAAAILKLEQQGKLSIDDKLGKFFPQIPADKKDITLHQLLTHTSGLPEYHDSTGDFEAMTRWQSLLKIFGAPLAFEPGKGHAYSNSGYTVLAAIVEMTAGSSYEDFVRKEIFTPAGMTTAGFFGDKIWAEDQVSCGQNAGKTLKGNDPSRWPRPTWALKGAGGAVMSAQDLYQWIEALKTDRVLNAAERAKGLVGYPVPGETGVSEGYGWMVGTSQRGTKVINAGGGSDYGFHSMALWDTTEDAIVIILGNSGDKVEMRDVYSALAPVLFTAQ